MVESKFYRRKKDIKILWKVPSHVTFNADCKLFLSKEVHWLLHGIMGLKEAKLIDYLCELDVICTF